MKSGGARSPVRTMTWLVSGIAIGAAATAALVLALAAVVSGDAPTQVAGPPIYVEESATSGVTHVYDGEFQFFVGGGVAVFDCNDDGFPDLYLAGGTEPAAVYVNQSDVGGALDFSRAEDPVTDLTEVTGAYPIDVDSDGIKDLAVLRVGENVMLRGLGDCRFEHANDNWGLDGGEDWTVAFSAKWEEGESLPTMAFGNYLALSESGERDECESHDLFRPDEDSYGAPTVLAPGWCTLSILFSDWGRTGDRDLRMTNDRHYYHDGEEQLWKVDEGEEPELYTEEDGWQPMQIWGMGIASHDVTGDGLPEVFLTSQGDNKLQTLTAGPDQPIYRDMALAVGANAHRPFEGDTQRPSTAWHAEFGDVNNDGLIDLFVTKGNVDAMPEFAMDDPNNLLLGDADGTFAEGAADAGIVDHARSRGAALADLNLDGLLDVVVVERREPVKLWRNTGIGGSETGNWLAVDVEQDGPNRDAIGSWIEVRLGDRITQQELTIGGGHAGGELGWAHFGLGGSVRADVRVIWPDGEEGSWMTVEANQFLVLERGSDTTMAWTPLQG